MPAASFLRHKQLRQPRGAKEHFGRCGNAAPSYCLFERVSLLRASGGARRAWNRSPKPEACSTCSRSKIEMNLIHRAPRPSKRTGAVHFDGQSACLAAVMVAVACRPPCVVAPDGYNNPMNIQQSLHSMNGLKAPGSHNQDIAFSDQLHEGADPAQHAGEGARSRMSLRILKGVKVRLLQFKVA